MCVAIKKHVLEKWLVIIFLVLKAESINISKNVEQEFPLINFLIHTYHYAMKNKCLKEPYLHPTCPCGFWRLNNY